MKRFIVIILVGCLFFLYGCNNDVQSSINDESVIGVIETKNNSEESRIIFYDKDLNIQTQLDIKYASINSIFYNPIIKDTSLFLIPKRNEEIIKLCLKTAEITSYSIGQPAINSIAIDDKNLYTCNTLNSITYISKYTFKSNEIKSIQLKNQYTSFITISNNKLYVFSSTIDNKYSQISCYDNNLNLLFNIDCTDLGAGVYQAVEHNDCIYFSVLYPSNQKLSNQLGRLNTKTNELDIIPTDLDRPFGLQLYENTLVITYYDIVNRTNTSSISLVDLKTDKTTTHSFDHGAEQVAIVDEKIYILTKEKIYCYSLNNWDLIKVTEVEIDNQDFSYITGIFGV